MTSCERLTLSERFAEMYRQSREDAGKSQEYCARALGVSRKTVQNWESGLSTPNQIIGVEWFKVLGLSPMPYLHNVYLGESFSKRKTESEYHKNELIKFIQNASPNLVEKLFYIFCGKHGSSPVGIVEICLMHVNVPMQARIQLAQGVLSSYKLFKILGGEALNANVEVDVDLIEEAIEKATEAVTKNNKGYTLIKGEKKAT